MNKFDMNKFDLTIIADRSGIPMRKLRYAIDHELVPGLRMSQGGRGNARTMGLFDAVALVVAAALLEAGITKPRVSEIMEQCRGARRSSDRYSLWRQVGTPATMAFSRGFATISISPKIIAELLKEAYHG